MSSARSRARRAPSDRTRVRRVHERAHYDRAAIDAVLDAALVSHLGFVQDGQPFVIPTLHARVGDRVYVHGSSAARSLRLLREGIPACLTVTLLDGIVLARSVFEHSVNYRSVVVLGQATAVTGTDQKRAALEALTERLLPGRWADARPPTAQELKATAVLSLPLDEASAKIRTGGPDDDDTADAELDVWAGHIPLVVRALPAVPAPGLRAGIPVPPYAARYRRPGLTT
jgi:nitroimidazol reductase NimA-like FMN-containing flavoprotein (pyridoxamine 5'-phosphate oxidase superfamily)